MPDEPQTNEPQTEIINDITPNIIEQSPPVVVAPDYITPDISVNPAPQNPELIIPVAPIESAPVPAVEQSTISQPAPEAAPVKSSFFKRKKVLAGLIIAIAIVIIGGVSTFAMTSWYQNPDKVLADSIISSFTSRSSIVTGNFDYEGGGVKVKVGITTKQANVASGSIDVSISVDYAGKNYSITTSALNDGNGDLFIKLSNIKAIIAEAKKALGITNGSAIAISVDKLVTKIDGTWVKISKDDLVRYSESTSKSKTCVDEQLKKIKNDNKILAQIADIYRNNAFVIIDKNLGLKDGKFSYEVKLSVPVAKSFVAQIKTTDIYKSMVACDSSFAIDENSIKDDAMDSSSNPNDKATLTVWVDYWSHQITKVEAKGNSGESTFLATLSPLFNQKVTIDTPQSSITLAELQSYIEEIYSSLYTPSIY